MILLTLQDSFVLARLCDPWDVLPYFWYSFFVFSSNTCWVYKEWHHSPYKTVLYLRAGHNIVQRLWDSWAVLPYSCILFLFSLLIPAVSINITIYFVEFNELFVIKTCYGEQNYVHISYIEDNFDFMSC